MKIYFAPIEGVTNYRYRNIHHKYYSGIDKYFIPFIKASKNGMLNKERKEVEMINNTTKSIPQIMSKNIEDTVDLIYELEKMGYDEVNLNFGCPSATVVPKGKGGGILKDLDYLDKYLEGVFNNVKIKVSIKIRIGLENENEFDDILKILNKYNIYELIIHPRTVKDYYTGELHLNVLDDLDKKTKLDIIYNGDIKTIEDIEYIKNRFPYIKGVMIGRGLIAKPDMLEKESDRKLDKLKKFYYELIRENRKVYGIGNSMFYEKQIWAYLREYFIIPNDLLKKLSKAKKEYEIDVLVKEIFDKCELNEIKNGINKISN